MCYDFPEIRGKADEQMEIEKYETFVTSSAQLLHDTKDEIYKPDLDGHADKNADRSGTSDSGSDGVNMQNYSRPLSPGTLALMCDEQDEMLLANSFSNGMAYSGQKIIQKSSNSDVHMDVYREQERLVLTRFWDVLRGLITHGSIKGRHRAAFKSLLK